MVNKYMKKCSISVAIREFHIVATLRISLTHSSNKKFSNKYGKNADQIGHLDTVSETVN